MINLSRTNGALVVIMFLSLCTKVTESYSNVINSVSSQSSNTRSVATTRSVIGQLYSSPKDFFGEPEIRTSFVIKEFSQQKDLKEIITLASQSLPSRPDGIVTVAKYTSATREDCTATEGQYERVARDNPASLFLRCFAEYENAGMLLAAAEVSTLPTYDIFYGGERIARVEGNNMPGLEEVVGNYQFLNSDLDLFSEDADNKRRLAWGEGKIKGDAGTPRTTAAFIPGYDWNLEGSAFDEVAKKVDEQWEDTYGDWVPDINDK